jgi:hypothetical protein
MKKILIFLFSILISNVSIAAISGDWFGYAAGKLGQDGHNALSVMTENGLILSRIRNDYAAFTFGENKLSDEEMTSKPIDVSEFDFVIEFWTCNSSNKLLSGKIDRVRYSYQPREEVNYRSELEVFVDEFIGIQKYFNDSWGSNRVVTETTEDKYVLTTKGSMKDIPNVLLAIQILKEEQNIRILANAPDVCPSN